MPLLLIILAPCRLLLHLIGDPGDKCYVVASGSYAVIRDNVKVVEMGAGQCFGELALLSLAPRAMTVQALTDGELFTLDRNSFRQCLAHLSKRRDKVEIMQTLETVPLFLNLSEEKRAKLSRVMLTFHFAAGTRLLINI